MYETRELIVPGYKHRTKGRYIMLVKQIYALAAPNVKVVLKNAADNSIYFSGNFDDFPYTYSDYIVDSIRAIGSTLVICIYD